MKSRAPMNLARASNDMALVAGAELTVCAGLWLAWPASAAASTVVAASCLSGLAGRARNAGTGITAPARRLAAWTFASWVVALGATRALAWYAPKGVVAGLCTLLQSIFATHYAQRRGDGFQAREPVAVVLAVCVLAASLLPLNAARQPHVVFLQGAAQVGFVFILYLLRATQDLADNLPVLVMSGLWIASGYAPVVLPLAVAHMAFMFRRLNKERAQRPAEAPIAADPELGRPRPAVRAPPLPMQPLPSRRPARAPARPTVRVAKLMSNTPRTAVEADRAFQARLKPTLAPHDPSVVLDPRRIKATD